MKKFKWIFPILLICCLLCGCTDWMNGSYSSVTPHTASGTQSESDSVTVSNYKELEDALRTLVNNMGTSCVIYTTWKYQDTHEMMRGAISGVMSSSSIAAYAVEKITYEIGTNGGQPALAVKVTYRYQRAEILRIKRVNSMDDAISLIVASLENYAPNIIVKVDNYEDIDLSQILQDHATDHPDKCVEIPQVTISTYPNKGADRIVIVNYTYQTSRDTLRDMQDAVAQVFSSAKLYVTPDADDLAKYHQLYAFLMERYDYKIDTSLTPSYSLLLHGVGDSKAFATVYAAMCRQVDLPCEVVSGTKNGEIYFWNAIYQDGTYYHVDLLQCSASQNFQPKEQAEMSGYVWDYSAFTAAENTETE